MIPLMKTLEILRDEVQATASLNLSLSLFLCCTLSVLTDLDFYRGVDPIDDGVDIGRSLSGCSWDPFLRLLEISSRTANPCRPVSVKL